MTQEKRCVIVGQLGKNWKRTKMYYVIDYAIIEDNGRVCYLPSASFCVVTAFISGLINERR